MTAWRYTAYDLRTGARLTDLDVEQWESRDPLKGRGTFSAVVSLDGATRGARTDTAASPITYLGEPVTVDTHLVVDAPAPATTTTQRRTVVMDSTRRGRSLIVAERDGVPVFAGIVWRRRYNARTRKLLIAGRDLRSYFDRHVPATTTTFAATDQFAIMRNFVTRVNGVPGGNIGLAATAGNSGVTRDRTYERFAGLTYGELMDNLSNVTDGFDYTIRVEYSAGAVVKVLRMWYPRRGRDIAVTNLRFTAPGNAVLYDFDEDGTDMAVQVFALGAGDGPDMLIQSAARTDLIDQGWPGYSTQRAYKDVTEIATLSAHAQADVDRLSGVDRETFAVQVDPTFAGQPWGSWDLGDDCLLVINDDPAFPGRDDGTPGNVQLRRVLAHNWTVGLGEELIVELGEKVVP